MYKPKSMYFLVVQRKIGFSAQSLASHAGVFRGETSSPKNACVGGYTKLGNALYSKQ